MRTEKWVIGFALFVVLWSARSINAAAIDEGPAPRTEAEAWGKRLKKLLPKGWTMTAGGSEIVVERNDPVNFARPQINAPAVAAGERPAPADLERGVYRLRLRFGDKVSLDEYQKLVAENAAATRQLEQLEQKLNLPHKFDDYIATTAEEKERLKAFREAQAKIVMRDLPDLYSPEHGIRLFQSWSGWVSISDRTVAKECNEVRELALRCFGMYDPSAAAGRAELGRPEPAADR